MKSFKEFVKPPPQGTKDKNGVPCAYISHDRKKNPPKEKPIKESHSLYQWTDEYDNEDEYELPKKLHDDQGTGKIDWDNPHHEAVNSYTSGSGGTNNRLYREHLNGVSTKSSFVDTMDNALSHKLKDNIHVYSGVRFDPDKIASTHKDRHIHLPAYTSTSIEKETALGFAQDHTDHTDEHDFTHHHVIHFNLKKGQKGMFVGMHPDLNSNDQISAHPREHEFILPRNTRIKIHPKHDTYDDNNNSKTYHIHHAHVVDNED